MAYCPKCYGVTETRPLFRTFFEYCPTCDKPPPKPAEVSPNPWNEKRSEERRFAGVRVTDLLTTSYTWLRILGVSIKVSNTGWEYCAETGALLKACADFTMDQRFPADPSKRTPFTMSVDLLKDEESCLKWMTDALARGDIAP